MTYKVAIRNNATMEVRIADKDLEWHEASEFWWTDGNFGCDCNRGDEWQRAIGTKEDDLVDTDCGHEKYSVLYVEFPDGKRINIDEQTR